MTLALLALLSCEEAPEEPLPVDSVPPADTVFTLAVVPDTQYYVLGYEAVLDEMFDWIAEQARAGDIAAALHEGDLVHTNTEQEWVHAEDAVRRLDHVVPYALCVGNHDMDGDGDTSRFNAAFPEATQSTLPGFGDTLDPELMDNAWHTFAAGGVDWLVVSLTYQPSDAQLDWGADVVAAHPHHRVIVLTHDYLTPSGVRSSTGERIWERLAGVFPNVTLVFNGHFIAGEASRLVSQGAEGNDVVQIFANYQTLPIGGQGRIRLVEVDTEAGTLFVRTYAPPFDVTVSDPDNEFLLEGLSLGPL